MMSTQGEFHSADTIDRPGSQDEAPFPAHDGEPTNVHGCIGRNLPWQVVRR